MYQAEELQKIINNLINELDSGLNLLNYIALLNMPFPEAEKD